LSYGEGIKALIEGLVGHRDFSSEDIVGLMRFYLTTSDDVRIPELSRRVFSTLEPDEIEHHRNEGYLKSDEDMIDAESIKDFMNLRVMFSLFFYGTFSIILKQRGMIEEISDTRQEIERSVKDIKERILVEEKKIATSENSIAQKQRGISILEQYKEQVLGIQSLKQIEAEIEREIKGLKELKKQQLLGDDESVELPEFTRLPARLPRARRLTEDEIVAVQECEFIQSIRFDNFERSTRRELEGLSSEITQLRNILVHRVLGEEERQIVSNDLKARIGEFKATIGEVSPNVINVRVLDPRLAAIGYQEYADQLRQEVDRLKKCQGKTAKAEEALQKTLQKEMERLAGQLRNAIQKVDEKDGALLCPTQANNRHTPRPFHPRPDVKIEIM
jgi:hypothetical protein